MITFECVIEYGRQYPTLDKFVYGKWGRFGHLGRPSRLSRLVFVLGLVPNVVQDHLHLFRDIHGAKERMNGEIPLGRRAKPRTVRIFSPCKTILQFCFLDLYHAHCELRQQRLFR